MSNDIEEEYTSGLELLGFHGMVYYKFLSMFRVKDGVITFGAMTDAVGKPENVGAFYTYLKQQKEWIKSEKHSRQEIRQRLWWVVQKVLDLKLFNEYGHRYIMFWHDSCDDQLMS
jgi:hypothetical protein